MTTDYYKINKENITTDYYKHNKKNITTCYITNIWCSMPVDASYTTTGISSSSTSIGKEIQHYLISTTTIINIIIILLFVNNNLIIETFFAY